MSKLPGKLCGNLIALPVSEFFIDAQGRKTRACWKFVGQIFKTGNDEFTVFTTRRELVGKYTASAFEKVGGEVYAGRIINHFALRAS